MSSLIKTVKLRVEWINYALQFKINSLREQLRISHIHAAKDEDLELRYILVNLLEEEHNRIDKLLQVQLEIKKLLDFLKQIELGQLLIELEQLINLI